MVTLSDRVRYAFVAGFLLLSSTVLFAQQGTPRTVSISGTTTLVQGNAGVVFTMHGVSSLSGYPGDATFVASGPLRSLSGLSSSDLLTLHGSMVYSQTTTVLVRLTVPAGHVITSLGIPA